MPKIKMNCHSVYSEHNESFRSGGEFVRLSAYTTGDKDDLEVHGDSPEMILEGWAQKGIFKVGKDYCLEIGEVDG